MKKLILLLLVLVTLGVGCQLDKNPFLGSWKTDSSFNSEMDSGDYCVITFYDDNTFTSEQSGSCNYFETGYYDYTETVLVLTFKGEEEWPEAMSYIIYNDRCCCCCMVLEGALYFYITH